MISSYLYIYTIAILFGIILPWYYSRKRRMRLLRMRRRQKGETLMTSKLLSECIGKKVELYGEGGISGYSGTVIEVENNLIKIEDKKTIRIINADMIAQVKIKKEQKD
ncbi:MAG: hypothetical protein J5857_05985 [Treponema sp.]|nr:hypothetical protein [Treponema sp.]